MGEKTDRHDPLGERDLQSEIQAGLDSGYRGRRVAGRRTLLDIFCVLGTAKAHHRHSSQVTTPATLGGGYYVLAELGTQSLREVKF